MIRRVRQLIVRQKTPMLNVICGLVCEFGHVIGNGPVAAMRFIKDFQTDECPDMPDVAMSYFHLTLIIRGLFYRLHSRANCCLTITFSNGFVDFF